MFYLRPPVWLFLEARGCLFLPKFMSYKAQGSYCNEHLGTHRKERE
jgi:hypothetical protein